MYAHPITATGDIEASQIEHNHPVIFNRTSPSTIDLRKGADSAGSFHAKLGGVSAETEVAGLFDDLGRDDISSERDASTRPTTNDQESR